MFARNDWYLIQAKLALSPRELEIVQHVFEDQTEVEIGLRLGISQHTVHTYLRRTYRKLNVDSRCQLLVRVMEAYLSEHQAAPIQEQDGSQRRIG